MSAKMNTTNPLPDPEYLDQFKLQEQLRIKAIHFEFLFIPKEQEYMIELLKEKRSD